MRLFIATSFPEEVMSDLNGRVARFKPRLPSASWVRPGSQHLTFAFLGEQHESAVEKLTAGLDEELTRRTSFAATLHGCGFFPNARHARVGWVGLDPESPFLETAKTVREAVSGAGVSFDAAEFKPHLTLMRIRDPWPPASIELFRRSLDEFRSSEFRVEKVTLYSSRLDPKGAEHTPLATFALA